MKSIKFLTKRSAKLTIATVSATSLLAACATTRPKIGFEASREADITRFKTFALLPLPTSVDGGAPGAALRYGQAVQQEIRMGMARLGYKQADVEQADVVVNVRGKVVPKVDVTNYGYSYGGYGRWGSYYGPRMGVGVGGVDVYQYKEGTLTIEAFQRASKSLVWVGWATGTVSSEPDETKLRAAVNDILAKFPTAAK